MIINGKLTSEWNTCSITTKATLDTETGEVKSPDVDVKMKGVSCLEKGMGFFTDENGDDYTICPVCHKHILCTVMREGPFHTYDEIEACKDPGCHFNDVENEQ